MSERVWLVTEAEKAALLSALELEKFHTPDQFQITEEGRETQLRAMESMHHRFHYHVCKLLQ